MGQLLKCWITFWVSFIFVYLTVCGAYCFIAIQHCMNEPCPHGEPAQRMSLRSVQHLQVGAKGLAAQTPDFSDQISWARIITMASTIPANHLELWARPCWAELFAWNSLNAPNSLRRWVLMTIPILQMRKPNNGKENLLTLNLLTLWCRW